ncbi:MAG: cell division FtsA domain-containing protein [Prevotellaceae bacterium]|jgi:hypothetical protein|nr:cell division FtsA domain-containing protein [Prevotellaceae bacterium]
MAHIFRIHKQGVNTIKHWAASPKIGTTAIDNIQDPNGASAKREITSIPSPFARMDLVKTAFKEVAKSKDLNGGTIYHKMVSDCLDIGQIFFNINKYKNFIKIIEWNRANDLSELQNSNVSGHRQLAGTYDIFLKQDASNYNFGEMQSIFILKCTHPAARTGNNIIGATSPATLFFSSANNLEYVSKLIDFGGDQPFDGDYAALCDRDIEYQKYWYLLQKTNMNFATLFPEVNAYLTASYDALKLEQREIINNLSENDLQNYADISVGGAGNSVNVLGINLKQQQENREIILKNSDFVINPRNTTNDLLPLVLPVDRFTQSLKYVTANWDPNTQVPYLNPALLDSRTLPGDGSWYPYLTISDFLEDTIIRMPYGIEQGSFFDGNFSNAKEESYLLPVTDTFFRYFTTENLMGNMPDGKKMIEMNKNAGGVTVKLRIPVKNNRYIEYNRIYFEHNQPDIAKNDGAVMEKDFMYALFPNIKFTNDKDAYYRLGLMTDCKNSADYDVKYYSNEAKKTECVIRNESNERYKTCKNYILENANFDYIGIRCNNHRGVVIPKFKKQQESNQYVFAIDLGTTNTHIEYRLNREQVSKAFDITNDKQIHLHSTIVDDVIKYTYNWDFIPEKIGTDESFMFPTRTVLSEAKNTIWKGGIFPFAHANIAFPYEKRIEYKYNRVITDLKWSHEEDIRKKIRCYIDSLFLILRHKVILNDGSLSATKIIWFYPISMTRHRFDLFKQEWNESYQKYFGGDPANITAMTESVAPYEHYRRTVGNVANMVSVDIGGGTTDIVIAEQKQVKHITSFRFAANSIFGDGYAEQCTNGIISKFRPKLCEVFNAVKWEELQDIPVDLEKQNKSSEIASFLFSLKNNKDVKDKNLSGSLDFGKLLQADDTHKIIFIFFYTAIIYHLAHIIKAKNLAMPRHITFSGNGSRVIQILTPDNKLLERFTKLIFEKIFKKQYSTDGLTILQNQSNPKEVTCKGGIVSENMQDYDAIADTKIVLMGSDILIEQNTKQYAEQSDEQNVKRYGNIDKEDYIKQTVEEVKKFIQFVIDLNNSFSFKNKFGIKSESLDIAKKECFRDLEIYTLNGLEQKLKEVSNDDPIEETFFFYPLNGMLNALSIALNNELK